MEISGKLIRNVDKQKKKKLGKEGGRKSTNERINKQTSKHAKTVENRQWSQ